MYEEVLMVGILVLFAFVAIAYFILSDPEYVDEEEAAAVEAESNEEHRRALREVESQEKINKEEREEEMEHESEQQ